MADGTELGVVNYDDGVATGIDRLPALRGDRWFRTVREMTEQDATVGAVLFAVEMAMRAVKWSSHSADELNDEANEWAEFLTQCFDDMPDAWPDIVADALTYVTHGYSLFEQVYKNRLGVSTDRTTTSNFNDGRIGWRKWAFRPQSTKIRWIMESGDVTAWVQRTPDYREITIPAEKFIVFRSSGRAGRAEGVSILKRAYRAFYHKQEVEVQEGIGIGRDLAGLLHVMAPPDVLWGTKPSDVQARTHYLKMMKHVHRGVQEGIMTPLEYDENNNPRVKIELLNSGGQRQFDTSRIIERYRTDIAMTMLADFVLIGHQQVGAYSVAASKVDTFTRAISGWVDMMEEAINEQAVSRLMRLNNVPEDLWPKWKHGDVAGIDLTEMGDFLSKMITVKALPRTPALAKWIAENINTPVPTEEELDKAFDEELAAALNDPTQISPPFTPAIPANAGGEPNEGATAAA